MRGVTDEEARREAAQATEQVMTWLTRPQQHLADKSRRQAIEEILISRFDRMRRRESRNAFARGLSLWGGLVGLGLTLIFNWQQAIALAIGLFQ